MSDSLVRAIGPCVTQNVIRVGYDSENWADDKPAVRALAEKEFGDNPSYRMVFASNPSLMNAGDEHTRGVYLEKRDIQMVWVDPEHPDLSGKTGKDFWRTRAKVTESLGLNPVTIVEYMESKSTPKFVSFEDLEK